MSQGKEGEQETHLTTASHEQQQHALKGVGAVGCRVGKDNNWTLRCAALLPLCGALLL